MTLAAADIEAMAMALPEATRVRLWDRQDVYKVRGKVFAICEADSVSFKATAITYEVLVRDGPGRPATGFTPGHWVCLPLNEADAEDLEGWIGTSYRLAAASLTRKARAELGLS